MPVNYERPVFTGANFKPQRGSRQLAKEKVQREETDDELEIKKLVRLREGYKCRWPEKHKCRGGLEVIHFVDRSLGGDYVTSNLWLGCKWIHRTGPKSIHSKDLAVEPIDPKRGCDGPFKFYHDVFNEATGERTRKLIAVESAPGLLER